MNDLLSVNIDTQTVSARELHQKLNIGTRFNDWFPRMCEYGFLEGADFYSKMSKTENGGRPQTDYDISVDMAKQICMIQRTPEGKKCRQYLIDLEKAWNTPEQVMSRALKLADQTINLPSLSQKPEKLHSLIIYGNIWFRLLDVQKLHKEKLSVLRAGFSMNFWITAV